jgi:hypothetical protein
VPPFLGPNLVARWTRRLSPDIALTSSAAGALCYALERPRGVECLEIAPADVAEAAPTLWTHCRPARRASAKLEEGLRA